ncbi:hypothetical protein [Nitrospira sp. CMX1]|nr:hypothetical protein [Nitrospira sp.]
MLPLLGRPPGVRPDTILGPDGKLLIQTIGNRDRPLVPGMDGAHMPSDNDPGFSWAREYLAVSAE